MEFFSNSGESITIQWKYKILLLSILCFVLRISSYVVITFFVKSGLVSFSRLIFEIESEHYVYAADLINFEWKIFSKISYDTLSSLKLSNHSKHNSTIPRPRFRNLSTGSHEIISKRTMWILK